MAIYLDNNATTKLTPEVIAAMTEELSSEPSNPSSIHRYGREAKRRLQQSKETIAKHLKVSPEELIFTSSGTEAINLAIKGYFNNRNGTILSSDIEHSCIFNTLQEMESRGCKVHFLNAGKKGYIAIEQIEQALREHKIDLMVFGSVNSETGIKNDILSIAKLAQSHVIPLIVDGVAILGKEEFEIPDGVFAMAFSAHKLHGPKGIGMLYKKKNFKLTPIITGGGQEKGLRSGTENLLGIIGFATAIESFYKDAAKISEHLFFLRNRLQAKLVELCPQIIVLGGQERVNNTLCVLFEGIEGETLLTLLDMNDIFVSHGSACSSGALEPSRVLLRMGYDKTVARTAIRFSVSRLNTVEEIEKASGKISKLVEHLRDY